MRYQLFISEKAREQLRTLEKSVRRQIGGRIETLRDDLRGNVRKLEGKSNRYRLRAGKHRVLFTLERNVIAIYTVKDRKEAYE
jgi:mRNA-degrading endonuclease RelE of RelBE toxin-antitoxin system